MKLFTLGLLLGLVLVDLSNSLILRGQHQRLTAAKARRHHQLRRQSRIKKFFLNDFPEAPLTFDVYIGTPTKSNDNPTPYKLSIETGERRMWTLSPTYDALTKDNQPYNDTKSKTSWTEGSFDGDTGVIGLTGKTFGDIITINGTKFNQTFGCVTSTFNDEVDPWYNPELIGFDGALGLGWDPNNVPEIPDYYSSPIHNILYNNKNIKRGNDFYVLWLANAALQQHNDEYGHRYDWQITFGLTDHQHCERNFNLTSLSTNEDRPTFHMSKFTYGDYEYDMSDEDASIDTGSPVIYMPSEVHDKIFDVIQPTYDWDTGLYTVDCSTAGTYDPWVFSIDDVDYSIPSSTYIVDIGLDENQCVLSYAISDKNYSPDWVLGNPWLMEHCVLFDIKGSRIGFAKPKVQQPKSSTAKPTTVQTTKKH